MKKLIGLAILSLVVMSLVSCSSKPQRPHEIAIVTRGNIMAQLPANGTVIPRNRIEIKPPVTGRFDHVLVDEGQSVRKGQILAWMSSSDRAALLDAARAKGEEELKHWEDVYKPAPVVAPLDGVIIKRIVQPGQSFSTSDTVLVMSDKLIVQAQVDETDIGKIKLNQKTKIILDAYPTQTIPGDVEQIAYESLTVNNVNVYNVNVLPLKVPAFFRSGMSATINFMMEEKQNILCLPSNVIKRKGGRTYVFINQQGNITPVQISTGLENDSSTEVISGLVEGNAVVIPTPKILAETLDKNSFRNPVNLFGKKK